nr:AbrB/MazE/SpoVT family DNA-binding domain-containing protein [Candidatus Burarchaeum sp.]
MGAKAKNDEPGKAGMCGYCNLSLENIRKKNLIFERKVSYAGRSLIITIPEDLARHMGIKKGDKTKLMPVGRKGFLVEVC